MSHGDRGDCVQALQYSLLVLGVGIIQDGIYSDQTRAAVTAFQQAHPPLAVTGVADPDTIAAIDKAANSPLPPSDATGTISPAQPGDDAIVGTESVYTCGNLYGTCSVYFSRAATREINNQLNNPGVGAGSDVSQLAVCGRIASKSPSAGLACEALGILGKYKVSSAAQRAVSQNACLKIKMLSDPIWPTSAAADNGPNCVGA